MGHVGSRIATPVLQLDLHAPAERLGAEGLDTEVQADLVRDRDRLRQGEAVACHAHRHRSLLVSVTSQ